jgi:hypothetical protein
MHGWLRAVSNNCNGERAGRGFDQGAKREAIVARADLATVVRTHGQRARISNDRPNRCGQTMHRMRACLLPAEGL